MAMHSSCNGFYHVHGVDQVLVVHHVSVDGWCANGALKCSGKIHLTQGIYGHGSRMENRQLIGQVTSAACAVVASMLHE